MGKKVDKDRYEYGRHAIKALEQDRKDFEPYQKDIKRILKYVLDSPSSQKERVKMPRQKKIQPMQINIYYKEECTGSEHTGGTGLYEGCDEDTFDFWLDKATIGIPKKGHTPYYESFEKDWDEVPEEVWVVYVRYSTGSTFGHSSGHGVIDDVFLTEKEAQKLAKKIKAGGDGNNNSSGSWHNYFGGLESVEVECLDIRKTALP